VSRQLVSVAVAADHLGLSEKSLRRYIAQGLITGYRVGQRRLIRVDLNEVETRLLTPIPSEVIKCEAEADPPLTAEQRSRLAVLLLGGGGSNAA
jgi:excisionase family DNA binding protein